MQLQAQRMKKRRELFFKRTHIYTLNLKRQVLYSLNSSEEILTPPAPKRMKLEEAQKLMFRFSPHTEKGIVLSEDRTEARRKNPDSRFDGGVYINTPLSGTVDFEIEVIDRAPRAGSLWLGIAQSKKGTRDHLRIPYVDKKDSHTCTWSHNYVCNNLTEQNSYCSLPLSVNLDDLNEGDKLGLHISTDGDLLFTFNGVDQRVVAEGVYNDKYDTYIFANLCDNCNAVRITRAEISGYVDQTKPTKSSKIEFGLHPISKSGIAVLDEGQYAQRIGSGDARYGVAVCGAKPIKPRAEFEVHLQECLPELTSFKFGIRMLPANSPLSQYDEQSYNLYSTSHCIWDLSLSKVSLYDANVNPAIEENPYGVVISLQQGDRVGLQLSANGNLIFYHNDRSQGVAVANIYQKFKEYDLYPLVYFSKDCTGIQVTRAGYKEDLHHITAIELAMNRQGRLNFNLMHAVLIGVPRSGKSSLMRRLLGEEVSSISSSTGVMDSAIHVKRRKSSSISATIQSPSKSESLVPIWRRQSFNQEVMELMISGINTGSYPFSVNEQLLEQSQSSTQAVLDVQGQLIPPVEEKSLQSLTTDNKISSHLQREEKNKHTPSRSLDLLKRAIQGKDLQLQAIQEELGKSWLLYLTDTGGQIEFQEVLPLLVSGPSVFFIVFRFNQDLNKCFTVEYLSLDQGNTQSYLSTMTVKEALLQSLASIAAMRNNVFKGEYLPGNIPLKPKVIFVGTHTDQVDQSQIRMIDMQLKELVKSTALYREYLVVFAEKDQLSFTVNNFSADDEDFEKIRLAVEKIALRGEFNLDSPSRWLGYSLAVREWYSNTRIISIDEAFQVAKDCHIESREELKEMLWFLHNKMGVLRYFQECSELQDIVILDPQLLFDKVTELIVDTFTFENTHDDKVTDDFKKRGIFPIGFFQQACSNIQDVLLIPARLICLLEHLRIIAPYRTQHDSLQYFIPCVLPHTDDVSTSQSSPPSDVPPLVIAFNCGYIPKGVTGALIVYLLRNEMESKIKWMLEPDQIFKNQLCFRVGKYNDIVTVRNEHTHFAVHCDLYKSLNRSESSDYVCNEIRQSVEMGLKKVTNDLPYSSDAEHSISFYCPSPECHHQPAQVHLEEGVPCGTMWCKHEKKRIELPEGHQKWFAQNLSSGLDNGHQAIKEACQLQPVSCGQDQLKDAFAILLSVASKWKNIACLLNIPNNQIKAIQMENTDTDDCLREILSKWLKRINPLPTWNALADVMDTLEYNAKAEEIRR